MRAEAILTLPDTSSSSSATTPAKTKDQSFAMEVIQELHGPKFMNRTQKAAARKLKETFQSIDKKVEAKKTARNDLEAIVFAT